MTTTNDLPELLTVGTYGELHEKVKADGTVDLVFMPGLMAAIMHFHRKKDRVLTQDEVELIRDNATVIVMPKGCHEKEAAGDVLYPDYVWVEYLYHIGVLAADQ